MCTSAYLILNNGLETILFQIVLTTIVGIAPVWRWLLQGKKEIIGADHLEFYPETLANELVNFIAEINADN